MRLRNPRGGYAASFISNAIAVWLGVGCLSAAAMDSPDRAKLGEGEDSLTRRAKAEVLGAASAFAKAA